MALLPPKLFLKSSLTEEDASNLPSDVWKISAPSKNSLFWSIILSYVISSERSGVWSKSGYELLLGDESENKHLREKKEISHKQDPNSIKKQVLRFNPFRHRSSIFFNPNMSDILRMFVLRLNRFGNSLRTRDDQWNNLFKLKAASKMLECQIVLLTDCSGVMTVDYYGEPPKNGSPQLVIFFQKDVQKEGKLVDVYAFGMSLEHSVSLRLDALQHFLKKTDLHSDDILQIKRNVQCEDNFLLFLLTSEWKHIIPNIYKSPYIAWKLADAGFNTNPCCIGKNGLSAFSYSLSFETTRILQILYNYAVNNFQKSDESLRNPSKAIFECLNEVGDSIKRDCVNLNNFSNIGDRKDAAIKTSREILQLKEYQLCCVEEMCGILQSPSPIVLQRKQIVISVLSNYFNYFHYETSTSQVNSFKNHIEFIEYYENLDNFTCLTFFDKVLSLNPGTNTNSFENTVLNLFLTVLSYKMFRKCKHGYHCSICKFTTDNCSLMFISYNHRNKFEEFGKLYLAELQKDTDNTCVDFNKTLKNVRLSLKDFPEITDDFLIKRLQGYLKAAIAVSLDVDPLKGLLTIERAMQVIGETLHTSPDSKSVAGHLLSACLVNDIVREFFNIRNHCLSKHRSNAMFGRINLENDIKIYKDLQIELTTLNDMLEPLYISQEFRTEEFLIKQSEMECKKFSTDTYQNVLQERKKIQVLRKRQYQKNKSKYKLLAENVLDYILRLIESKNFKKGNDMSIAITPLKFVLSFIAQQSNIAVSVEISSLIQELDNLLATDNEINQQLEDGVKNNITKQKNVISNIFSYIKSDSGVTCGTFSKFHKYFEDVKNAKWFTDQEISDIGNIVLGYLPKSNKSKEELQKLLETNPPPSPEDVKKLLENILTNNKNKETILTNSQTGPKVALKKLKSIKNINENSMNIQELIVFSEKEEGVDLLLRIKLPAALEKKMFQFLNRNLECLLNRIKHLKKILIDEDDVIQSLWKWGKSSEIKKHTRFLMGQRYMRETDVRGSLEMLLFDCMNILTSRKDLEELWTKSTNLFSGVNLRDVLAHGSTVLEVVGRVLDPEDLPSQFIDKVLELIEDSEALQELTEFWKKTKPRPRDLKELEESITDFQGSKNSPQMKIKSCKRWKAYLSLLPLK